MNADHPKRRVELLAEDITGKVIGSFFRVYNVLGFGFSEKVYNNALAVELAAAGINFRREVTLPVFYRGVQIGHDRCDWLVEETVILETKATYRLADGDARQLLSYLVAAKREVGLLLHFGPKAQFQRVVASREHFGPKLDLSSSEP